MRALYPFVAPLRLTISRLFLALLLVLGTTLASLAEAARGEPEAQPKQTPDSYYSMTMGRSGFELVVTQYWSAGALFRSVLMVAGHPIVSIVNGKNYYTYDDLTGEGYLIGRSARAIARDDERPRPFALELQELLADGGEKIREETLNGIRVEVYRVTDNAGRRTLWVTHNSLQLPLKLEAYERGSGRTAELDWVKWIPGLIVKESFFEPPKKLDLRRFDDYAEFLKALADGPILPSPPLFYDLLHEPDDTP